MGTLPGAFANAQAALRRFGANILVPVNADEVFLSFQQWMKPVEAMGKTIGKKLSSAMEYVVCRLMRHPSWVTSLAGL